MPLIPLIRELNTSKCKYQVFETERNMNH